MPTLKNEDKWHFLDMFLTRVIFSNMYDNYNMNKKQRHLHDM